MKMKLQDEYQREFENLKEIMVSSVSRELKSALLELKETQEKLLDVKRENESLKNDNMKILAHKKKRRIDLNN